MSANDLYFSRYKSFEWRDSASAMKAFKIQIISIDFKFIAVMRKLCVKPLCIAYTS